jgi:hypothetical protein
MKEFLRVCVGLLWILSIVALTGMLFHWTQDVPNTKIAISLGVVMFIDIAVGITVISRDLGE